MREGDTRLIDAARHGGERACRRPQLRRDVGIGVIPTDAEEGVGVEKAKGAVSLRGGDGSLKRLRAALVAELRGHPAERSLRGGGDVRGRQAAPQVG